MNILPPLLKEHGPPCGIDWQTPDEQSSDAHSIPTLHGSPFDFVQKKAKGEITFCTHEPWPGAQQKPMHSNIKE